MAKAIGNSQNNSQSRLFTVIKTEAARLASAYEPGARTNGQANQAPKMKESGRRQIREVRTGVAASGADVSASPAPSNSRIGNTVARENGLNCDCSSERVHRRPTKPSPRSYASGNCNRRPGYALTLHRKAPRVRQCRECKRGMRWYPPA